MYGISAQRSVLQRSIKCPVENISRVTSKYSDFSFPEISVGNTTGMSWPSARTSVFKYTSITNTIFEKKITRFEYDATHQIAVLRVICARSRWQYKYGPVSVHKFPRVANEKSWNVFSGYRNELVIVVAPGLVLLCGPNVGTPAATRPLVSRFRLRLPGESHLTAAYFNY